MNLFSRFFQENQEKFLAFAYSYLRDKAEAEDFTAFLQSLNISKQMLMDTFMKGVKVGMCMATEKQSA